MLTSKHCSACAQCLPLTGFDRRAASNDGYSYKCKACAAAYRNSNRERYAALRRAIYELNRDQERTSALAYYHANRDVQKARHAAYVKANAERFAEYRRQTAADANMRTAARRAALLQRTPAWLTEDDFRAIHAMYEYAAALRRATGLSFHVDHELPLRGARVSGLHVPNNLRVLFGSINMSKGNRFDPATAPA